MNSQLYIVLIILALNTCCFSQQNFNKHFQIDSSNLTSANILLWNNTLVSSFLNFDSFGNLRSGLAFYNLDDFSLTWDHFPNFRVAKGGILNVEDKLFVYGKNVNSPKNLGLFRYDLPTKTLEESYDYQSNLEFSFPFEGTTIDHILYRGYSDNSDTISHREYGILKIDTSGELLWQRNYNAHYSQSSLAGIESLTEELNSDIYAAAKIQNNQDDYGQILRINAAGQVVDSMATEEMFYDFTSRMYFTSISNKLLVSAYEVQEQFERPFRIDFHNSALELQKHFLIPSTNPERISLITLKSGTDGKSFFLMGSFTDFNNDLQYGLVIKVSDQGNILWQHRYQHPDFMDININYSVYDFVELENGDMCFLGNISPNTSQKELWLFKTNSNGCFIEEECDEELLYTNTEETIYSDDLIAYPNPVDQQLHLSSTTLDIAGFEVYNMQGQLVKKSDNYIPSSPIDLSTLVSGCYAIKIRDKDHKFYRKIIFKL